MRWQLTHGRLRQCRLYSTARISPYRASGFQSVNITATMRRSQSLLVPAQENNA